MFVNRDAGHMAIATPASVSKPSLYYCFGNKEGLFRLALDRYERSAPALKLAPLDAATSIDVAVGLLLRGAAMTFGRPDRGMGCMILTGTISSHPDNVDLVSELGRRRQSFTMRLANRLSRWTSPDRADVLARCLVTTMQGMALQAHDGADLGSLREIADGVTAAFADRR